MSKRTIFASEILWSRSITFLKMGKNVRIVPSECTIVVLLLLIP